MESLKYHPEEEEILNSTLPIVPPSKTKDEEIK